MHTQHQATATGSEPVATTISLRLIFFHFVSHLPTSRSLFYPLQQRTSRMSEGAERWLRSLGPSTTSCLDNQTCCQPRRAEERRVHHLAVESHHHKNVNMFPRVRRKWCKTLYMSSKDPPSPRVGNRQIHLPDVYTDVTARNAVPAQYLTPLVRTLAKQPLS